MKARAHLVGAIFGTVCAVAFALAPLASHADAGPSQVTAPRPTVSTTPPTHGHKKHMHRGNVGRKDDGCGD
jgi:hypothetical protein